MRKARLWGLLWMLFVPEIQAATKLFEEKCTLAEGQTLTVSCPTNTNMYSNSQKAWQRLKDNGEVQTLAITEGSSQVQKGKYFLEDIPSEGMLQVRMTNLQVEDSGLYRCVILGPSDPIILFYPVRLVVTKNSLGTPDSDEYPCQISVQNPTLPPVTTKLRPRPRPRPVTQLVPTSADRLSSPGLTVTPTNVTHITRYGFQVSGPLDRTPSPLIPSPCAERVWGVRDGGG
uniref:Triggering receptor expressed on myeloid cells 1 n=1 Tax=Capra hircus TaxID=9925 RepID=A0A8C2PGH1_CAPHI